MQLVKGNEELTLTGRANVLDTHRLRGLGD